MGEEDKRIELTINDVEIGPRQEGYRPVKLLTTRGDIESHYYEVPGAQRGVIWVGGVGGGFDTPARGLYPRLCRDLAGEGIASLRVRFRHPTRLDEATMDAMAGLAYLEHEGIATMAAVGHSFGGAVVIQAALAFPAVRTVVTLATQSYGAGAVSRLTPRCSILLIHGSADRVLRPDSSEHLHRLAGEPKRLVIYEGAGHLLEEVADAVYLVVRDWLIQHLGQTAIGPQSRAG